MQQSSAAIAIRGEELSTVVENRPRTIGAVNQLNSAARAYQREEVINLSPVEVVKKLYDAAIQGCKKNNPDLAQRAITELVVGLNFEYQEISVGLYRLYQYAKQCIRKGQMTDALKVLEELRSTWVEAFHLDSK